MVDGEDVTVGKVGRKTRRSGQALVGYGSADRAALLRRQPAARRLRGRREHMGKRISFVRD